MFTITWAFRNNRLIHVIDRNIDNERAKIINDLVYTGCVDAAQLVSRPWVPQQAKVATGEMIHTDGAVAVLELNPCRTPLRTLASDAPLPVSGGKASARAASSSSSSATTSLSTTPSIRRARACGSCGAAPRDGIDTQPPPAQPFWSEPLSWIPPIRPGTVYPSS